MKKACIAYTTDCGYLFPSLLSAIQAKDNVDSNTSDVAICYIGESCQKSDIIHSICAQNNILFIAVAPQDIEHLHIMYARLFLDQILGYNYERIIYIDGDTQIAGSLQNLIDVTLPTGMILAARDPMILMIERGNKEGQNYQSYLQSIGIKPEHMTNYFNSGVMVFNSKDWEETRNECLEIKRQNPINYTFPDQDILNLTAADRNLILSFKWNFPIYFLNHKGIEEIVKPHIYHFMSNPRPWQGAFWPWGDVYSDEYTKLIVKHPELRQLSADIPTIIKYKYKLQQIYKYINENLNWSKDQFKLYIENIENKAII